MACLDISSLFITKDLLNQYYSELDINTNTKPLCMHVGHHFDYEYRSPNQITTIETENNQKRVRTYASAQNYYQSDRARLMSGPELAEKVRLSEEPLSDGYVSDEDYKKNVDEWNRIKIDVAFKCNWLKFTQNKDLAHELLLTGNRPIISSRDSSWGEYSGKIMMIIREDLRRQTEGEEIKEKTGKRKKKNEGCSKSPKCLKVST